jgi:hypothetical protein
MSAPKTTNNNDNVSLEAVIKNLTNQVGQMAQVIAIKDALIDVKDTLIEEKDKRIAELEIDLSELPKGGGK